MVKLFCYSNLQEALKLLRSTMSVKCSVYGDYSAPVADTLTLMAAVHLADSDLERALKAYQKVGDQFTLANYLIVRNTVIGNNNNLSNLFNPSLP